MATVKRSADEVRCDRSRPRRMRCMRSSRCGWAQAPWRLRGSQDGLLCWVRQGQPSDCPSHSVLSPCWQQARRWQDLSVASDDARGLPRTSRERTSMRTKTRRLARDPHRAQRPKADELVLQVPLCNARGQVACSRHQQDRSACVNTYATAAMYGTDNMQTACLPT